MPPAGPCSQAAAESAVSADASAGGPGLGVSGSLAQQFLDTEITPLLALVGLLLGLFAVLVTPREEEPQIDVTFANVFIAYPGASASEVEQLVSTPMERILSEIDGAEHIYSVSRTGHSILTVQFEVGEPRPVFTGDVQGFEAHPDARRILVSEYVSSIMAVIEGELRPESFVVVLNWFDEVRAQLEAAGTEN